VSIEVATYRENPMAENAAGHSGAGSRSRLRPELRRICRDI